MLNLSQGKTKFKDKCDICERLDFLKGYNGKCYCPNCLKKVTLQKKVKQLSIFDMENAAEITTIKNREKEDLKNG